MAAYETALAGQPVIEPGSANVMHGSMRALAISYFRSPGFVVLKPGSQVAYRLTIENFCKRTDQAGKEYGSKSAVELQRKHIVQILTGIGHQPYVANYLLRMLQILMRHAVEIGLRTDNPARDIKPIKIKSDGYHAWTEDEIARFEHAHPVRSRERLALALLLYTGQRRSDVIRMGPQHVQDGFLRVRQAKTSTDLLIPIHAELRAIIDACPPQHLTFIATVVGRPFSARGFTNWFGGACKAAGLVKCTAHGLRKAAARRLAEAGASTHEISAITGHRSLNEVSRYTRAADQKRLATSAMARIGKRTSSG
jgi:integrase